jgi:hypothetical protein
LSDSSSFVLFEDEDLVHHLLLVLDGHGDALLELVTEAGVNTGQHLEEFGLLATLDDLAMLQVDVDDHEVIGEGTQSDRGDLVQLQTSDEDVFEWIAGGCKLGEGLLLIGLVLSEDQDADDVEGLISQQEDATVLLALGVVGVDVVRKVDLVLSILLDDAFENQVFAKVEVVSLVRTLQTHSATLLLAGNL